MTNDLNPNHGLKIEDYYKLIESCSYKIQTNLDYSREELVQELILIALQKLSTEGFQHIEGKNRFWLMKKVLTDWGIDHTRRQIRKTDLCKYDKGMEVELKEKLFQSANEYRGNRQESPEDFAGVVDLTERLLAFAGSVSEDFHKFVANVIEPSNEVHEAYNLEVAELGQMNRSAIPPMTVGRLIGLTKKQSHNFLLKLREYTSQELGYAVA